MAARLWSVLVVVAVAAMGCGPGPSVEVEGSGASVQTTRLDGRDVVRPTARTTEGSSSSGPPDDGSSTMPERSSGDEPSPMPTPPAAVTTGARSLIEGGMEPLAGRRVGLIANRASMVGDRPLIDVLHDDPSVDLVALFAPEHGITAEIGAGETADDGLDRATGLTVYSLYGVERAPTVDSLSGVDVLVFDLQDVGTRFYTYTATMGLAMRSAARAGIPFVVLDRPNPLGGDRPDGPLRAPDQDSFVGLYPIPSVHGLTAGELAWAIKGERWLEGLDRLDLRVVELEGWDRQFRWGETGLDWEPPSPGLPTAETALLYPATVLLEATTVSHGRGTDHPFRQVGAPGLDGPELTRRLEEVGLSGVRFEVVRFTPDEPSDDPADRPAVAHAGVEVVGVRLQVTDATAVRPMEIAVHLLHHLLELAGPEIIDQPDLFDRLAGHPSLRRDLAGGRAPADIVASWDADLEAWDEIHRRYRLYELDP